MNISEEKKEKLFFFFWLLIFFAQFLRSIFFWRGESFLKRIANLVPYFNICSFFVSFFLLLISRKKNEKLIFLLPFFSFAFFSTIWSVDQERTLFQSFFSLSVLFSCAFISLSFQKPKTFLLKVINIVSFLGLFSALFALFLLFFGEIEFQQNLFLNTFSFGPLVIFQLVDPSYASLAPHSFFNNKNNFAFFLSLSTFFTFFLYFLDHKKIYFFSFIVQFLTLLSTYSRASVISFFTFLFLFFLFFFKKKEKNHCFSLLFLFVFLFCFFLLFFFLDSQRWLSYINQGFNRRTELWKNALESWSKRPILGMGFGSAYQINFEKSGMRTHFHNTFLTVLAELGIIGFFLFFFLWFLPVKNAFNQFKKEKDKENIIFLSFLLAYQGGMVAQEIFETRIFSHFTFSLWATFTFILLNPFLVSLNSEKVKET